MKHGRLRTALFGIGISLIVLSLTLGPARVDLGGNASPEEYRMEFFSVAGGFSIEITTFDGSLINFYLLNYQDAVSLIETRDIENTIPIHSLLAIGNHSTSTGVLMPGLYCLVVETASNETASFEMDLTRDTPQFWYFLPGLSLVVSVAVVTLVEQVYRYRGVLDGLVATTPKKKQAGAEKHQSSTTQSVRHTYTIDL